MASKTNSGSSGKPAAKATGSTAAKKTAKRAPAGKTGPRRPSGKPVKPIKPARPWGMIIAGTIVGVLAIAIIVYGAIQVVDSNKPFGDREAQQISGVVNYRDSDPAMLTNGHKDGKLTYKTSPPVGGDHNGAWQNCQGDVYTQQIPNEHAVHSMEHGAVWITYSPDLPADQVKKLADKVNKDYMLMSPYPGLDKPVSLQAWGFQLKLDSVDDPRIDEFITAFRQNANVEPGATCSSGVQVTGDTPQSSGS